MAHKLRDRACGSRKGIVLLAAAKTSEYREISSLARSLPRIRDTDDYLETVSFSSQNSGKLGAGDTQKFPVGIVGGREGVCRPF